MRIYDKLTESIETLGEFLKSLPVLESPWEREFQKLFCAGCNAENCENCRNEEYRNNPIWWLGIDTDKETADRLQQLVNADFNKKRH